MATLGDADNQTKRAIVEQCLQRHAAHEHMLASQVGDKQDHFVLVSPQSILHEVLLAGRL